MRKIYSNRCWVNEKLQAATISLEEELIVGVDFYRVQGAEDFGNQIIMPGVIDIHVHINEPGRADWEGFETATQAAAAGGTTTIVDMPLNSSPVSTTVEAFLQKLAASAGKMNVNCGFYGGLIPGNSHEIEGLINAGVVGVKCFLTHSGIDEFPNVTEEHLNEAMPIIAKHNIPLLVHGEIDDGFRNELSTNPTSYATYLKSRPKKWENDAIELMIRLSKKHNCWVHIVHVSSSDAIDMIESAQLQGVKITAETCAQYIYFNAEEIPDASTIYKCAPPIREKLNNELLKSALISGILTVVATDHSPAPANLKEIESGNLHKAWGGIAGIQYLLQASWTSLQDSMSLEQFIPLLTSNAAKMIGADLKKGKIAVGFDADLVIWEPEKSVVIAASAALFKHKISPYIGKKLNATITETIVNGNSVFINNSIKNFHKGKWLIQQ